MLSLLPIPANDGVGSITSVTRWRAAARAYGIEVPDADAANADVLAYLAALTTGTGGLVPASDLISAQDAATSSTQDQFGYRRQSIWTEAASGRAPRLLQAARGEFDPDAITEATKAGPVAADLTQVEVDGVPVLRWRADLAVGSGKPTALSRTGSAGRLGLPDDRTLLYAAHDAGISDLIYAYQGGPSLADDPDIAAVAEALDGQGALSALITPSIGGGGLEYEVAGAGFGWDGRARMILVYSTASTSAGNALGDELEELVTEGRTLGTRAPWSDYLAEPHIVTDGAVVTATFTLQGSSTAWAQFVYRGENLF